jgi:dienelactone hydrolase
MKTLVVLLALILGGVAAEAGVVGQAVEYREGGTVLEGFLAFDDAAAGKRPGVLVVHEWMGLNDYAKRRARELAGLGYVAFAADIYGKGVRPGDAKEAGAFAGKYKADRKLLRARVQAGLDVLRGQTLVDSTRLAAIGYCFGGTTVLELARSGAQLSGVVSFHGGLDTPTPEEAKNIRTRVLVLHGGDDPYVPPEQVQAFWDEMRKARVDYQLVAYGGAVHSFTNPEAGNDPSKGAAYNETADRRSWQAMKVFFGEIFR